MQSYVLNIILIKFYLQKTKEKDLGNGQAPPEYLVKPQLFKF